MVKRWPNPNQIKFLLSNAILTSKDSMFKINQSQMPHVHYNPVDTWNCAGAWWIWPQPMGTRVITWIFLGLQSRYLGNPKNPLTITNQQHSTSLDVGHQGTNTWWLMTISTSRLRQSTHTARRQVWIWSWILEGLKSNLQLSYFKQSLK